MKKTQTKTENKKAAQKTSPKKAVAKKAATKKVAQKTPSLKGAQKKFIVVANWKMNPATLSEAKTLFNKVKDNIRQIRDTDIVICPPAVYLDSLSALYRGKKISLGAQTIFPKPTGSFTGEMSAEMVKSVGAKYVIVGHSERRKMGETDEDVKARINAALAADLIPIVCIGEKERDNDGEYLSVIRDQIHALFYGTSRDWFSRVVIAYEPIWAIGKNSKGAVTMHALHETAIYIRKVLSELFDKKSALAATILYGGSVDPSNAGELIDGTQTDGFLVGRASLSADQFLEILSTVENYAKN